MKVCLDFDKVVLNSSFCPQFLVVQPELDSSRSTYFSAIAISVLLRSAVAYN